MVILHSDFDVHGDGIKLEAKAPVIGMTSGRMCASLIREAVLRAERSDWQLL